MSRQPTDELVDLLHDVPPDARLSIDCAEGAVCVCHVLHNGSIRPLNAYDRGEISVDIAIDTTETPVPSDQFPTEKGTIAAVQERDGNYTRPTLSIWHPGGGEDDDHLIEDGYTDSLAVARIELND
jgi:hypothetical protein